jgi:hypothetical protein
MIMKEGRRERRWILIYGFETWLGHQLFPYILIIRTKLLHKFFQDYK